MSSTTYAKDSYVLIEPSRIFLDAAPVLYRLFAVFLVAASLVACAQSSVITRKSKLLAASRQTWVQDIGMTNRHVTVSSKRHPLFSSEKRTAVTKAASYGLASFYMHGARTASGEKFDPHALTAAHPTLPFGTRLRVTNVTTGRSVTVRINDRGPFVPGRVVDVSYSAAEKLGIIQRGIAKVKLDVVRGE
jgi:rare lipoprotein A